MPRRRSERRARRFEKAVEKNTTCFRTCSTGWASFTTGSGRPTKRSRISARRSTSTRTTGAICYLGIVLHEKGEKEEADEVFKRALAIGAESPNPISKFLSEHLAGRETSIPPLASLGVIRDQFRVRRRRQGRDRGLQHGRFRSGRSVILVGAAERSTRLRGIIRFELRALVSARRGSRRRETGARTGDLGQSRLRGSIFLSRHRESRPEALPRGHFPFRKGRLDQAPRLLRSAVLSRGDLLLSRRARQGAKTPSKNRSPSRPRTRRRRYYYGLLSLRARATRKRAIEYLSDATKHEEKKGAVDLSFGSRACCAKGISRRRWSLLKDILDAGGESADVLHFLGEYLRMEKLADAERFFRHAINSAPISSREGEARPNIIGKGDYEGEKILDPPAADFADLFEILGDIKFHRGKKAAAERFYRKSLEVHSSSSEANLSLALTLWENEARGGTAAEALLKQLVEHDPQCPRAHSLRARSPRLRARSAGRRGVRHQRDACFPRAG